MVIINTRPGKNLRVPVHLKINPNVEKCFLPPAVLKVDIKIEVDWGDIGAGAIAVLKIEIVAPSGGILKIDSLGDLLKWPLSVYVHSHTCQYIPLQQNF